MHKIPTIILALFIGASNFIATPIFSFSNNQISVSATVQENLQMSKENGQVSLVTNTRLKTHVGTTTLRNQVYKTYTLLP